MLWPVSNLKNNKVVHTSESEGEPEWRLPGTVNGKDCKVVLDMGAQMSVLGKDLVDEADYTGRFVSLSGFDKSGQKTYPIATVHCNVDRFSFPLEVAVFDQKNGELLLGRDAGGDRMFQLLIVSRQQPKLVKETRLQKRQRLAEETHLE